jgi:ATP-dependent RNA helicase DHX37/DHR1
VSGTSGASREEVEEEEPLAPRKRLGFKNWALKQIDAVKGYNVPFDPNVTPMPALPSPPPIKKRKLDGGSMA